MNLVDELHVITNALTSAGIAYAVCGGVAVTVYGATRSTKGIDILIARVDLPRVLDLVAAARRPCAGRRGSREAGGRA